MSTARVSVTIPTYNRAARLRVALRSVLEQSFTDIEVFVSDNASDDDTAGVVKSFDDPRVHYLRNEHNLGHFANLSRGLHLGDAPYVAILPDDDFMLAGHLANKVRVLDEHPEAGLVHSAFRRVVQHRDGTTASSRDEYPGGEEHWVAPAPEVLRRLLTERYYISYATALFRRSIIRPDEEFAPRDKTADDVGLSLRLVLGTGAVAYDAEPDIAITWHEAAHLTTMGGQGLLDDAYVQTLGSLENEFRVKREFVDVAGPQLHDAAGLRAGLDARMRAEFLRSIKRRTRTRRRTEVARLYVEAARLDPAFVTYRPALRYLASTLAGPLARRGRARA